MIRLELWVWRGRPQRPFLSHCLQSTCYEHDLPLLMLDSIGWWRECFSSSGSPVPSFRTVLFARVSLHSSHLRRWRLGSHSLKVQYLRKPFGILLQEEFSYSVIYSCRCGLALILSFGLHPALSVSGSDYPALSLGALSVSPRVTLACLGHCVWHLLLLFCFEHFLLPHATRCSRHILYVFCPSSRIGHFSKEP